MENEISTKRGLILILVIASIAVFIGLVWLIATFLPRGRWGFSSQSIVTSTPRVEKNCTYPVSYWIEHPELYPPQIVLGDKVYQANDIRKALSHADQDPAAQLQAQLVGAFLNISSGANQEYIETTIFQAYNWLVQHPDGSQISTSDLETGSRYYTMLEAYNLGVAGVPSCLEGSTPLLMETTTPTVTSTYLLTLTPSQTLTPTASETATQIDLTLTATYSFLLPTNTAIWKTQPPIQLPSNTPIRPTEQPVSTPTVKPPPANTPTNTSRPPDTPTNTPITPATLTPPPPPPATLTPPSP